MRPLLLFDAETVHDADMARRVSGDAQASDDEALARVAPPRSPDERHGFPKPLYHRVVEIAVCVVGDDGTVQRLRPLGPADSERHLLETFWDGYARLSEGRTPVRIVTFNGRRFDVPVLVHRALLNGVSPAPWWAGDYRIRFRESHLDLMEVLSDYGTSTSLSQHETAVMLGIPGKLGVDGADVHAMWAEGRLADIAAYCTADVATLTLAFARLAVHTGWCTPSEAEAVEAGVRAALEAMRSEHPLYRTFLDSLP